MHWAKPNLSAEAARTFGRQLRSSKECLEIVFEYARAPRESQESRTWNMQVTNYVQLHIGIEFLEKNIQSATGLDLSVYF
jgi:hypothetical protein